MEGKVHRSKRPFIIISVVFIVVVVIVGAVVWKVTKDAYEDEHKVTTVIGDKNATTGGDGNDGGDGDGDGDDGGDGDEKITEEELKLHPWKRLRLPRNIMPVHYDITMYPNFYDKSSGEFHGNETLELDISSPSQYLFIHIDTDFMNITDTKVYDNATNQRLAVKQTFVYKPNQFFVIEGEMTFQNAVRVEFMFEGTLLKALDGLYKSTYVNSKTNETRYLAASKFEPTMARRAFPCLDEPNMKATYTITLIHDPSYTPLSNMNVDTTNPTDMNDKKMQATKFHKSVKMSTYLVCFIVCDFESVSTTSNKNTPIRVFATPDKQDETQYALEMAKYTIDLYEDLFQLAYPLPKQDLIAIPDFVAGAMEHWGLITFQESSLLYNPANSPLYSKKRVATVVAHEMAHQWFGNTVTMDWWNDLWLNEGFAAYMEYVGTSSKEKDWDMDTQFLIDDLLSVMPSDSVISSHPIVVAVKDPAEITSLFDSISYEKGASVIRMLYGIMGKKKFFQGIAAYLKEYEWGNAKTDDLWKALGEVDSSINVKDIMDSWTLQDGFPYVNISMVTTNGDSTTMKATQQRFLSDPNAKIDPSNSPFGYKWYINLDYHTSSNNVSGVTKMKKDDVTFDVPLDMSCDDNWIKFNKDKTGFYRVLYPNDLWERMSTYLNTVSNQDWKLTAADRADLLSDAYNMAAVGKTPYSVPLSLTSYLSKENHLVPWLAALEDGLDPIGTLLLDDPEYDLWKEFRLQAIKPSLDRIVFDEEGDYMKSELRTHLYDIACADGDVESLERVRKQFRDWLDNGTKPPANVRRVVYRKGMRHYGTDDDWVKVWNMYTTESSPSELGLLLQSLTSTTKSYFISRHVYYKDGLEPVPHVFITIRLLDRGTREDGIRTQDFFNFILLLGINPHAQSIVWTWMRETYTQLEQRFTTSNRNFGRMAYRFVGSFTTSVQLQEVEYFFSQHPDEGTSARYRKMALESIKKNINWLKNFRDPVFEWIKKHKQEQKSANM